MSSYQAQLWWPWIDHSSNILSGLTVTVPASDGALIVAALTTVVGMAGDATWTIMAYALHQWRAKNEARTGLFRMQQVSLRNAGSAIGSALEIIQIGHAWSGKVVWPKLRSYSLALIPIVTKICFILAGIFVGYVTVAAYKANVILLNPTNCGVEVFNATANADAMFEIQAKHANDTRQSRAYANNCYDTAKGALGCTSLPIQKLPFSANPAADCPFGQLCVLGYNTAFQLSTPMLDSLIHLGINAQEKDRVTLGMSTTCSVFDAKEYTQQIPDPNGSGQWFDTLVLLGVIPGSGFNYTWKYTELASIQSVPYTTYSVVHYAGPYSPYDPWAPIAPLSLQNADTSLLFSAANSLMYEAPVYDPMFFANGSYTLNGENGKIYYRPNYWFTTVACADQINICNPTTGACSQLTGSRIAETYLETLGFNDMQKATAERIILAHLQSHTYDVVNGQGGDALAANTLLYNLFSPGLPKNQWQLEATNRFQIALANIQHRIVEFPNNAWDANGTTTYLNVIAAKDFPPESAMNKLCKRQLVRSTDEYQSFHLAGIIIIAVISGTLIILSWTLDCCVRQRPDRRLPGSRKYHKRLAYLADGKFQLVRMALKPAGYDDGWEKEMEEIPCRRVEARGRDNENDIREPEVHDGAVVIAARKEHLLEDSGDNDGDVDAESEH